MSIFYIILALLGFGILIFVHELAHLVAARWAKMKVEIFSIGFGKPIYQWTRKKIKWQLCIIPFGGYVKISGMQEEKGQNPYNMHDGFFGKSPKLRILVALAGPLANVLFALLLFTIIWLFGGSEKHFSEVTRKIGWIEPSSALYQQNVRPGDEITSYGGHPYNNFKDVLFSGVNKDKLTSISGYRVNYYTNVKEPFSYTLENYRKENYFHGDISSIGVMAPASYLIYKETPYLTIPENSPMKKSGIVLNDHLLWADGELLFSLPQLMRIINTPYTLLTIERNGEIFQTRIEKVKVQDVKLDSIDKAEIDDWRHEANLKKPIDELFVLPYIFNKEGVIEGKLENIDTAQEDNLNKILKTNDRIIAVDGQRVFGALEILKVLQKRHVLIVVKREQPVTTIISSSNADKSFDLRVNAEELNKITNSIGTRNLVNNAGNCYLLKPVIPIKASALKYPNITIPKEEQEDRMALGIILQDEPVKYNPNPFYLFSDTCHSIGRTLASLTTGNLNPKWLSGPIGVMEVMHYSWMVSFKEALFWLALISLNLGILNLLPIPVLDGGHILFSLIEMISGKKLKIKTMEKLIIPFVVLLVLFFIYVTYYDLVRIFDHYKEVMPNFLNKLFGK